MNRATSLVAAAIKLTSRSGIQRNASLFKTATKSVASSGSTSVLMCRFTPQTQERSIGYRPKSARPRIPGNEVQEEINAAMDEHYYETNRENFIELPDKHDPKPEQLLERPEDTIFAKIVAKQIPSKVVFEDEKVLCFQDINAVAPHHYLIIPKKPIAGIDQMERGDAELVGHCLFIAKKVALDLGFSETGYRVVTNNGRDGQQSVRWLHFHLIGGRRMIWPPG